MPIKDGDLLLHKLAARDAMRLSMEYDIDWAALRFYNKLEGTAPSPAVLAQMFTIGYPKPTKGK